MLREKPSILSVNADASHLFPELDYTLGDITLTITGLPSDGIVLKADRATPVVLGDTLTAAELAALSFAPKFSQSGVAPPRSGQVIYIPQSCGRLPIPPFIDLPAGQTADKAVVITEIPTNGSIFLADGMTIVVCGQSVTAAQLCGLTFRPAANAAGQISLLRYRSADQEFVGEVLLVVGPDVPSQSAKATDTASENSSVAPLAAALLLGVSSLKSAASSAAVETSDLLPADSVMTTNLAATTPLQLHRSEQATASVSDQAFFAAASEVLEMPTTLTESTTSQDVLPHHRIGSSTPPDFLSPKPASSSSTSSMTAGSFQIANNAVLEIKDSVTSSSGTTVTFDTGSGELILDRSAQFQGQIGNAQGTTLSPNDLIDLKDLPFTASMSASVQYNSATNISTVGFSNGSSTVTLQFSGQDPNWIFKSDGQGGTIVSDPPTSNAIVLENQKPGTPQSVWQVAPGQDSTKLEGFTTAISTSIGGTVQFKIDNLTGNPDYQVQIYRLGYYGGDGARLITTLQHTTSVVQPAPITDAATGEVDAGNWSVTDSWAIPTTAVSGVYIANVVQGSQVFQIPFVVNDPSSTSDIVFQTDDETWQAYNGWGGANLYGGNGPSDPPANKDGDEITQGAAYAVSYNRPIMTQDGVGQYADSNDSLFGAEYAAIYWLEENGYDVSYISGTDTATDGALLLNHKVFMDAGHDEYWTDSQVANVKAAEAAGVSLAFLSGNEVFWQTQLAPSIDGSNTADRTLVSYKDSHFEQTINPSGQGTGTFEAPTSWGGAGMPSNALTGTVFSVDESGSLGTITIPYDMTQLRFWRNTSVADTAPGQTASLESGLLGYEWDSSPDNGFMPAGLIDVSSTTLQEPTAFNTEFGNVDTSGTATHNLVEYRDPTSGALVFGAGTVFWSWGLSNQHDQSPDGSQTNADPNVQQATVNLLADMGVQPETLQASLVIASASNDHTPPTSTITNVSSTAVPEGQTITVSGTATDAGGGVVGAVQISTDSGKTWHVTSGQIGTQTVSWTYTFNAPAPGTYSIETRAVDDSLNLETPGAGVSYTVSPSSDLSLFASSVTPAETDFSDPNGVEVGVQFTSSSNGQITAIRFYKGSLNTGPHVVDLWSANGTLLATATSTNETASGWQQVNFSSPVSITAGATYVASYHMTNGEYADTPYYFDTLQNPTNGSLSATADGLNGVYAYSSSSIFPNIVSTSGDNYWVDVVLNDATQGPQAVNESGFVTTENTTLSIPASTLLAQDTDTNGLPLSITGVSNPSNGTVTYNSTTQTVSFVPASNYAGPASFDYTITDGKASATGSVSLSVNYALTAQSLFFTNETPAQTGLNDGSPIEVGVQFTASVAGQITALKFYRSPSDTGTDLLDLWSSNGTNLASVAFTNTAASGWQTVTLAQPVAISADTTYVASYHTNGEYVDTDNFFTSAVTNGQLTAQLGNGFYSYGGTSTTGIFPTSTFDSSNYYADVVFSDSTSTETPPVLVTQTPNQTTPVGLAFSLTLPAGTFKDPDGGALTYSATEPSWLTFNAATQTFSGTPTSANLGTSAVTVTAVDPAGLSANETFNITVATETPPVLVTQTPNQSAVVGSAFSLTLPAGTFNDPDGGALTYSATEPSWLTFNPATQTFSGTPTSANVGTSGVTVTATDPAGLSANETFNIAVTSTPPSVSLFSASNTPTQTSLNDGSAIEVGVKFTASVAGEITALKFYRSPGDTGTDLLDLWTSSGTKLASVTFTNTTASGWQTVSLTQPVSISANTTYVASYHTTGEYVVTDNFFTSAVTSGQLTAPSSASVSGGNGVYSYGGTSTAGIFPTSTFSAANYFADVVFSTADTPPVLVTQTPNQNAIVGSAFSLTLPAGAFNDPDGGTLTYSATEPSWLSFNAATRTFSGTPTSGNVGTSGVTVTATDPAGLSASETFNITVANETPPVLVTQTANQTTVAGSAFSLTLPAGTFNDPDGGALTYKATGLNGTALPTWLTFNVATQTFSGTPTFANDGTVGVQVTATDPANLTASETFNITVDDAPPVLVTQTPNQSAVVGSAFSLTLPAGTFNDPDGGALTYSATEPSWLAFNAANQTFSGTPTSANVGTSAVTVTATDPAGLSANETFNIGVTSTPSSVSLFSASNTPTQTSLNDGKALEVGVKFSSSVAGEITALKFYRSASDTGTDILDLWSSTGTKLASANFTNTTASGWQTVDLTQPVSISANTTYVASYHTTGEYVVTNNFFTSAVTSGQLTAPSSASVSGGNGVYTYGGSNTAGVFPTHTFNSSNYFADVVFQPQIA